MTFLHFQPHTHYSIDDDTESLQNRNSDYSKAETTQVQSVTSRSTQHLDRKLMCQLCSQKNIQGIFPPDAPCYVPGYKNPHAEFQIFPKLDISNQKSVAAKNLPQLKTS